MKGEPGGGLLGVIFLYVIPPIGFAFALYLAFVTKSLSLEHLFIWILGTAVFALWVAHYLTKQQVSDAKQEAKSARQEVENIRGASQVAAGTILKKSVKQLSKVHEDGSLECSFEIRGRCLQDGVCYDKWGFGGPDTDIPVDTLEQTGFWFEGEGITVQVEEDSPLFKRLIVQHGPPLRKDQEFEVRWGYKWPKMVHTPQQPRESSILQRFPHITELYELEVLFTSFLATEIDVIVLDYAMNPLRSEIERVREEGFRYERSPDGTFHIFLKVTNPFLNCYYGVKWKPIIAASPPS